MAVTSATLIPLYIQRIGECLQIQDSRLRLKTWTTLAEPVSILLELPECQDLLDSVFSDEEFETFRKLVRSYPHESTAMYLVARPESAKLSEYASVATLPSMPWNPRLQGSATIKKPTNNRNLRSVHQIPTWEFFGRILSCKHPRVLMTVAHPRLCYKLT